MVVQPFIRCGTRSNATARRLIANSQNVAPHLWASTYFDAYGEITKEVSEQVRDDVLVIGTLIILPGYPFYLVASKFAGLFYVVQFNDETPGWECSATDPRVQAQCISKVLAYLEREEVAA